MADKAEEQPADQVTQSDEVRVTPSQQGQVITTNNTVETGAIQGANIDNSTLNNTVINIKGESLSDQLKTFSLLILLYLYVDGETLWYEAFE